MASNPLRLAPTAAPRRRNDWAPVTNTTNWIDATHTLGAWIAKQHDYQPTLLDRIHDLHAAALEDS